MHNLFLEKRELSRYIFEIISVDFSFFFCFSSLPPLQTIFHVHPQCSPGLVILLLPPNTERNLRAPTQFIPLFRPQEFGGGGESVTQCAIS